MTETTYAVRRTNPRFSFFADVEVTLRDGTLIPAQLTELSSRGCYIETLEPILVCTELLLRICDGMSTNELHGKVIYVQSGGGLGLFGMGVQFEEMGAEQRSVIDEWIRELAGHRGKVLGKNSELQNSD
jgi:PilZ domain